MKRIVALFLFGMLFAGLPAVAQTPATVKLCIPTTGTACPLVTATAPLPVTGSLSITFPTIGAAVPATGVYNAINVAGTLRGWSGLSVGSIFPGTVAIVDASGNQITSFGATTNLTPITPATATATQGTLLGGQYSSTQATFTNGQQGAVQITSRGEIKSAIMDAAGNARGANVDASNNLQVTLGTTSNNIGGYDVQLAPTVTVQNAAYSAGNSLGGLITITGAARTNGGAGNVTSQRIKSTGGSTNVIWVYAWSKTPVATCTDKTAFVASTSDNAFAIPGFPIQVTLGGSPGAWDTATYAQIGGLFQAFKNQDTSPGTAIYECWVTAGSVTPATTGDLTSTIGIAQD